MKLLVLALFALFSASLYGQSEREFEMTEGDTTYIMKKYYMVFLVRGDNRDQAQGDAAEIQKGHLAHINKLSEAGKVVLAGPFEGNGDIRGILLFDVDTAEEALELESEDPAVKSGRLKMEVHPWWGAKGTTLK